MQKSYKRRYQRLAITTGIFTPTVLLFVLIAMRVIPLPISGKAMIFSAPSDYFRQPLQLSHAPYTNGDSQHFTELEPDTYSFGSTIVSAFQAGLFCDLGSAHTRCA